MLLRGIPVIMYGTEFGFNYPQQQTRSSMWSTRFNVSAAPLHATVSRLNQLRREHRIDGTASRLHFTGSAAVLLRGSETHGVWLFTNAGLGADVLDPRTYCAPGLSAAAEAGSWVDVLSGTEAVFTADGCYASPDGWPKALKRHGRTLATRALHTPAARPSLHVYAVETDDGEHPVVYFKWFLQTHAHTDEVDWHFHVVSPSEFLDEGGINRVPAGSVVLIQSYHARPPEDVDFSGSTMVARPRLLRESRLWAMLNASVPLIFFVHNDGDCSLELPNTTHHVFYRDTWSAPLHAKWHDSRNFR